MRRASAGERPLRHRSRPAGKVAGDRRVELDLALVEEEHDRRGGADHLAERREVVDGLVGRDARARGAPAQRAEAALDDRRALATHHHRRARITAGADPAQHHAVDGGEPLGGHADGDRRLERQAVGEAERERERGDESREQRRSPSMQRERLAGTQRSASGACGWIG
jgi:hypothetical protein